MDTNGTAQDSIRSVEMEADIYSGALADAGLSLFYALSKDVIPLRIGINLKPRYKIALIDQNKRVRKYIERDSDSFLLNFMVLLNNIFTKNVLPPLGRPGRYAQQFSYIIGGKQYGRQIATSGWMGWAFKGDESHGIVIGMGTKEVDPSDTWLENQIHHGFGKNEMVYLDSLVSPVQISGNIAFFNLTRRFINASGSNITVTEIGWAVDTAIRIGDREKKGILLIRDLVPPITVPNEYVLVVTYQIQVGI